METTITRFDVELNGVRHSMTEEQIGNLVIDASSEEIAQFVRMIKEEKGEVEQVLFEDEYIGPTEGPDYEALLNELVSVQDRMAGIMKAINAAEMKEKEGQGILDRAKAGSWIPKEQWTFVLKSKQAWGQRRKELWARWWTLKEVAEKVTKGEPRVWAEWFNLGEEDISRYLTSGETEEVDDQIALFQTQVEVMDELEEAHYKDEQSL